MREAEQDFESVADLVPEGCTPFQSLRLVEYLTEDGEQEWHCSFRGDVPRSAVVGLLEMVKLDFLMADDEE